MDLLRTLPVLRPLLALVDGLLWAEAGPDIRSTRPPMARLEFITTGHASGARTTEPPPSASRTR